MHPFKFYVFGNAAVWATVILAAVLMLGGTPYLGPLLIVLGGGAVMSVGVLGSALWRRL